MKKLAFLAVASLMLAPHSTLAQTVDPSGVWLRDDGNARVRIARCGAKICATNEWIGDTSKGENVGDRLVMSLQPKASDTLEGTAYDEKRGRSYAMTLKIQGSGLVTRGCVLGGLVCRDVSWAPAN